MFCQIRRRALWWNLFVLSSLLWACHAAKPTEPPAANLALVHYFSGALNGGLDTTVNLFNAEQAKLHLTSTAIEHEAYKTWILAALQQNTAGDLMSYWAGARTQDILPHLTPIDDLWQSAGLDQVFPAALTASAASYGGHRYLLPLTQHLVGFFYNRHLMNRWGLAEPTTWTEFLDLCRTAKRHGVVPIALGAKSRWPAQFFFDYLLLRTAGADYRQRLVTGQAAWTDPPVVRAFQLWKDLLDEGLINTDATQVEWDTEAGQLLVQDRALVTLMGTWLIGYLINPEIGWKEAVDFGFFPFPAVDSGVPLASVGPIDGLLIPAGSKNPAGAKQVLAKLAGIEAQESFSAGSGALAPNLQVPDSFYSPLQREVKAEILASQVWAFNFDLASPPAMAEVGLDLFRDFLSHPDQLTALLARAQAAIQKIPRP